MAVAVNGAPTAASVDTAGVVAIDEDTPAAFEFFATFPDAAVDPDGDALSLDDFSGTSALGAQVTISSATGAVAYDGSLVADLQALGQGETIQDSVLYRVTDGVFYSNEAQLIFTVAGVNDAVTMTDQTFAADENTALGAVVASVVAIDIDANDTLTFTATTDPTGTFGINAAGEVVLLTALDFETLSSYSFTVEVSDGFTTATATVSIDIVDVAEPLFTPGTDSVDFNVVLAGTYVDGTQYDALDGHDLVFLPNSAGEATASGFVLGSLFDAGAGDDTITGGGEADLIKGGVDDDMLIGGTGDDTFVFADGDGHDTIGDFLGGAGASDVIDLTGVAGLTAFADVQAAISQVGADTVLALNSGDQITLLGVNAATLAEDDFLI